MHGSQEAPARAQPHPVRALAKTWALAQRRSARLCLPSRPVAPANGVSMIGTIGESYRALVAAGEIERDPGQESVVEKLVALEARLAQQRWAQKSSALGWLFGRGARNGGPVK